MVYIITILPLHFYVFPENIFNNQKLRGKSRSSNAVIIIAVCVFTELAVRSADKLDV